MLRTVSTRLAAVTLGLMMAGQAARAEAPNVAVDIAPVHSLVARVMEGAGTPDLILPPGASPHGYSMRPSEARALQNAGLVIWVGEGLTPWLSDALENLSGQAQVITLLDLDETQTLPWRDVDELGQEHDHAEDHAEHSDHDDHGHDDGHDEPAHDDDHGHEDEHAHEEDHDDDHGHEDEHESHEEAHDDHDAGGHDDHDHHHHGAFDPHVWLDPQNAAAWLPVIAQALAQADPDNAELYQANAEAGQAELAALSDTLTASLAAAQGRGFVVFHDAYQYFETRFGLQVAGTINQGDATSSGAAHLTELRDQVREKGITCALSEPQYDASILTSVLGDDLRIGMLDPLGSAIEPGPALYPQMLRDMAQAVATCTAP